MSDPILGDVGGDDVVVRRPPMPGTVKAAIGIAGVFLGLRAQGALAGALRGEEWPMQAFVSIAMAGLIMVGLVKGHRLAWQWGRVLGLLYGGFLLLIFTVAFNTRGAADGVTTAVLAVGYASAACLVGMGILLGQKPSREYFLLKCPRCDSFQVKAADFFFNNAICKRCRHKW